MWPDRRSDFGKGTTGGEVICVGHKLMSFPSHDMTMV